MSKETQNCYYCLRPRVEGFSTCQWHLDYFRNYRKGIRRPRHTRIPAVWWRPELPADLKARVYAAAKNSSVMDWIMDAILRKLEREESPHDVHHNF